MYLRSTVALITGGAQGLGKGFARAVLEAGGKVSILDIKEDVGSKTAEEFNSLFGLNSTIFFKCDVRNQQEIEAAFQQTYTKFGKLDLVVNNAGTASLDNDWQKTIDINLTGVMRCCLVAANYLSGTQQVGHIINISSAAGLFSIPFDPAYAASKHGVVGLSRSLSEMWESKMIRVNCLCPTYVDTELLRLGLQSGGFKSSVEALGLISVDDVVKAFKKLIEENDTTGGVLLVNPFGIKYKFPPRRMKNVSKL